MRLMFLKCRTRRKDGKVHRTWSIVESRRYGRDKVAHRHVLYLGEINDGQVEEWERTIAVVDEREGALRQMSLFPDDRVGVGCASGAVHVRLSEMRLSSPRRWGDCWLADELWRKLHLDTFFEARLEPSREGTQWEKVLRILVAYRLLSPGSEWRLHREWFRKTALGDLLDVDARCVQDDTLYRCHDLLHEHREDLFRHLHGRWSDLFGARYEVVLYDLTSTYFECDVPSSPDDPRRFGYSRDKRSDCVQVVVALAVTPDGLPLAYEMLPGNRTDKTTLAWMLDKVRERFGEAERIWVMDRGIPTEEVLSVLRARDSKVHYLVGTPKGRLNRYAAALSDRPWQSVRDELRVKLLPQDGEVYVLAESQARACKERGMRVRSLKQYWKRLGELASMDHASRDALVLKLGKAQEKAGRIATGLVRVEVSVDARLRYSLDRDKLREVRRKEGCYLLRTNMDASDPELVWRCYMQLCHVEEAFRTLKGDLGLRPVFHKTPRRIEAHLFISFLSYCLSITLRQMLRVHAPGLTPRSVFEKLETIQMLDVALPTTDGRELHLLRRTEPDADTALLLHRLNLELPPQSPPRITS